MHDEATPADAAADTARGRLRLPPMGSAAPSGSAAAGAAPTGTAPDGGAPAGLRTVVVDGEPVGLCHVPDRAAERLVVLLHGAGGAARDGLRLLLDRAEERRLMLFAPQSAGPTWDVIRGGYGPDVWRIRQALVQIRAAGDVPSVTAIGGFSDGASYALSLGLANGDVFDAVLAFSPGFAAPAAAVGRPAIFVSHGRADRVLPIGRCSRRLVPALRGAGYQVHYHEFDGGHVVPAAIVAEALDWLPGAASAAEPGAGR